MNSLFVRLFISLLLVVVFVTTLSSVLFYLYQEKNIRHITNRNQNVFLSNIAKASLYSGRSAYQVYHYQGIVAYKDYVAEMKQNTGNEIFVFLDKKDNSIVGEKFPVELGFLSIEGTMADDQYLITKGTDFAWFGQWFKNVAGAPYFVVVKHEIPAYAKDSNKFRPPPPQSLLGKITKLPQEMYFIRVILFILVGIIGCYLLARSFTAPIKRLRVASRKLAMGEFSSRAGLEINRYAITEIKTMANDFDMMAAKLENLMKQQQRLFRDISHELRSPLARLRIALELSREKPDEKYLQKIEIETERLDGLIDQILLLSRYEQKIDSRQEKVSLNSLLIQLVKDAKFEAEGLGKGVILEAPEQIEILANKEILSRGIENIIRNAICYTAPSTNVKIDLTNTEKGTICIKIRDFGQGVPADKLEAIFEPFYRLEHGDFAKQHNEGRGVGLAIAFQAVRFHNGRVLAQNASEGSGLEIKILFPS